MNKRNALAALLAVATLAPISLGQTNEELQRQFHELRAEVSALRSENAELRGSMDADALEAHVNALAERYALAGSVSTGADSTTISGEIRTRWLAGFGDTNGAFVGDGGGSFDGERDGTFTTARARLGFEHKFSDHVVGFVELQGLFTFGDNNGSSDEQVFGGSSGGTSVQLYQAWIHVGNIFDREELSSRTGRQEFVMGNQFHFGNADWYNGYTFDGTRWDWDQKDSFHLTAFGFKLTTSDFDFNQGTTFFGPHDDDEIYGLYATFNPFSDKGISVDLYWFYVNGHGGSSASGNVVNSLGLSGGILGNTYYFHTLGGRLGGAEVELSDTVGLNFSIEFAYQFGDANGPEGDIEGFAVEGEIGARFGKENPVRAFIRVLWATGPDDDSGYLPLFPNRHSNSGFRARYGFYDVIPMTNVLTVGGGLSFDPAENWTFGAHFLWGTQDEGDDDYGWELDVFGEYRYSKNLVFQGGVAVLDPDDGLTNTVASVSILDDELQFLFWLQARLVF